MKKLIVFAFLVFCSFCKAQQTPPCWWTPGWDWMDVTYTNWQYYNGSMYVDMGTPFQNPNPAGALAKIIDIEDYTTAKGWVLLSKDFGCQGSPVSNQLPFFGLYNRFTGVVRFFFYNANTGGGPVNKALFTSQWNNPQKGTSLLNFTNSYLDVNNAYPKSNDESLYPVNIDNYAGGGSWYVAEFSAHFDHTTGLNAAGGEDLTKTGADYKLLFRLYQVSTSTIELTGSFQFNTEVASFTQSSPPTVISGSPNPISQILADAKKFLGKVPSEDQLKKIYDDFDQQVNNLNTSINVKSSIKDKFMSTLYAFQDSQFRNVLTTAASFAPPAGEIISGAMTLLDLFIDKPTSSTTGGGGPTLTYMAPTISKGTLEMHGTSVTTGNAKDFSLQIPGVNHKYQGGNTVYSGLPYYDCPLGVINLENEPLLSKRSENKLLAQCVTSYTATMVTDAEIPPLITGIHNYVHSGYTMTTYTLNPTSSTDYRVDFDYYKVNDNVNIAINDASGLELQEIQYQLVVELAKDNSGSPIFDALKESFFVIDPALPDWRQHYLAALSGPYNTNNCHMLSFSNFTETAHSAATVNNPVLDEIKKGNYIVNDIANNMVQKYSTPFIPANKFKGTAIRCPKGSKVILKMLAKLKPIDPQFEQTPVVIVQSYELKVNESKLETDNTSDSYYSNTCEQQIMATDGEAVLSGQITIPGVSPIGLPYPSVLNHVRKVTTSGDVTIDATTTDVHFILSKEIAFETETKIIAVGGNTFNGYIDPYQSVGGCVNGQDALQINHYFVNCDADPTHRVINPEGDLTGKLYRKYNELSQFEVGELKLYCYPNPNNGSFNIVFSQVINSGILEIFDSKGNLINSQNIDRGLTNFNVENLDIESGLYFLHFKDEKNDKRIKFIVVR